MNGVSADFYTLWEAPGELRVADTRTQSAAFRAALTARDAQQYDRALTLLRQCTSAVEPAGLAYARGTVWQAAGEPEMAALFFQRAAELDPNSIRDQAGQGIVRQEKLSGTATDR